MKLIGKMTLTLIAATAISLAAIPAMVSADPHPLADTTFGVSTFFTVADHTARGQLLLSRGGNGGDRARSGRGAMSGNRFGTCGATDESGSQYGPGYGSGQSGDGYGPSGRNRSGGDGYGPGKRNGNNGDGYGPGNGNGNNGDAPKDGTGNGPMTGGLVDS